MLFATMLFGSYPQPEWLIDRKKLAGRFPPRVRAKELWRISDPYLAEAQEMPRYSRSARRKRRAWTSSRTAISAERATPTALPRPSNPGTALDRSGHPNPVPRIVGKNRRRHAVEVEDLNFLKRHTRKPVKITVPGPFTMSQQAQNDFYGSDEEAAMDYVVAVNAEIRDLFAAGADIVQVDEPYMQARPEKARQYGLKALIAALDGIDGIEGTTAVHICFGYAAVIHERPSGYSFLPELAGCGCHQVPFETAQSELDCAVLATLEGKKIMVGAIDLNDMTVETPEQVVARIKRALPYVRPENAIIAPDCCMKKYLLRDVAFGKMRAMAGAAKILRQEYAGIAD